MAEKKNLLTVAVIVFGFIVIVWFSTSIHGFEKKYEIQPQVSIPEYRTDAARAIDAYERLMDRFLTLNEQGLGGVAVDIKTLTAKLDKIDKKLSRISRRIAKIEKKLGIKETKMPCTKDSDSRQQKYEKPAQEHKTD